MPEPLTTYIQDGYDQGGTARAKLQLVANGLYYAGDQIAAENWPAAKTQLYAAGDNVLQFGKYLLDDTIWAKGLRRHWYDALQYIDANWPSNGGVTMDDILNEMLAATFSQLTKFMGITQAYKTAIWDAPFNEEFYAALARGFKTW